VWGGKINTIFAQVQAPLVDGALVEQIGAVGALPQMQESTALALGVLVIISECASKNQLCFIHAIQAQGFLDAMCVVTLRLWCPTTMEVAEAVWK
jgi:hypothetical protein